jgi:hypothetical protein
VGYRNPVITRRYDDLVEEGDTCHVIIRNPQTMPGTEFTALASRGDTESGEERIRGVCGLIANLVIGWRVWDPTVPVKADQETGELIHDEETQPRLLPLPATAESVAQLPQAILMDLMNQVTGVMDPPQPSPADGTSKTS